MELIGVEIPSLRHIKDKSPAENQPDEAFARTFRNEITLEKQEVPL